MAQLNFPHEWSPWEELAPGSSPGEADALRVRHPSYGRYLEDFRPGDVFVHPRGITLHAALAQEFATTFMEACPLFLNEAYPKALGFPGAPVPPLLVLATTLSLGVQNESEKAVAHLGYYDVCFPRATYAGDTLRAMTRVLDRKERGAGEPGIVHVQTLALNQRGEVVLRYERKIMIPARPAGARFEPAPASADKTYFPWPERPALQIPQSAASVIPSWTGGRTFFEDFTVGEIIAHANGRTVTDEHVPWTYRLGNTHPLHFDRVYTKALPAPMGGEPVVYGGLVFSWIAGLASRDTTENMVWDLGYTQGYHTRPVRSGDTLYALSRVLAKEEDPRLPGAGIVAFQLIGLRDCPPVDALKSYGRELFIKENDKRKAGLEKIPAKVFEIERKVLLRRKR
jgi:2-methylfumaryl-CoA hydratase